MVDPKPSDVRSESECLRKEHQVLDFCIEAIRCEADRRKAAQYAKRIAGEFAEREPHDVAVENRTGLRIDTQIVVLARSLGGARRKKRHIGVGRERFYLGSKKRLGDAEREGRCEVREFHRESSWL